MTATVLQQTAVRIQITSLSREKTVLAQTLRVISRQKTLHPLRNDSSPVVNPIWDRSIQATSLKSTLRLSSSFHLHLRSGIFLSDSSVQILCASLESLWVLHVLVCDALRSERREEGRGTVISGTWAMRKSIPLLSSPGGSDQRDNRKPRLFTKRTCCVNPEGGCSSLYYIQWTHTHTHKTTNGPFCYICAKTHD